MRILLTGGGTGGHIYPLIAVAESIQGIAKTKNLSVELCYIGPKNVFREEFEKLNIEVKTITGAKLRRYFDIQNIIDIPKFFFSLIEALFKLFFLMPDVVFSKGGSGTLAIVIAAKFYMIPVVIHESDAVPSLTTKLSATFAKRIAISFAETTKYFSAEGGSLPNDGRDASHGKNNKIALLGNPVRQKFFEIRNSSFTKENLGFDKNKPLILILGGSQGAQNLNQFILDNLPELLKIAQIFHQVGPKNILEMTQQSKGILKPLGLENDYQLTDYLSLEKMAEVLKASDLVISRGGSGAIFEIAATGKPSIIIPLPTAANNHQKANAYTYHQTGGCEVIEESNLKINLVLVQINNILNNPDKIELMKKAAKGFAKPNAAQLIAEEILRIK